MVVHRQKQGKLGSEVFYYLKDNWKKINLFSHKQVLFLVKIEKPKLNTSLEVSLIKDKMFLWVARAMPISNLGAELTQDRLPWAGTPNCSSAGPAGAWAGHPLVAQADRAVPFHTSRSASVPVGYPSVAKTFLLAGGGMPGEGAQSGRVGRWS